MTYVRLLILGGVLLTLAGCGGSGGGDASTQDTDNAAPQAAIRTPANALMGSTINLSGADASDPDGDDLTYEWALVEKPDGATSALGETSGSSVSLTPDTPGAYRVALTVSDGQDSALATSTFQVADPTSALLQQSSLQADTAALPGETVTTSLTLPTQALSEIGRSDIADALTVNWSFCDQPAGSGLTLDRQGMQMDLQPDVVGDYCVEATVDYAGETAARFRRRIVADDPPADHPGVAGAHYYGTSGTTVEQASFDLFIPNAVADNEISVDSNTGERVLRTEIVLEFATETLIGQANDLLDSIDGRIVAMLAGADSAVVRIPDPGSLGDLQTLVDDLTSRDIIIAAETTAEPAPPRPLSDGDSLTTSTVQAQSGRLQPQALPPNYNRGSSQDIEYIDHHLAVRGHAAWNMRAAISPSINQGPWIVITDYFGDGAPGPDYAAAIAPGDFNSFSGDSDSDSCGRKDTCRHGYHVLGTILGDYGGGTTQRDQVAGIYPYAMRVRAYDMSGGGSWARMRRKILKLSKWIKRNDADARIVVNSSIGSVTHDVDKMNRRARRYTKAMRNKGLENTLVHSTSAGNRQFDSSGNVTGDWDAQVNSAPAYAALGSIQKPFGNSMANLENILVVENWRNLDDSPSTNKRARPRCLSRGSITSGNIGAIGTQVFSFGQSVVSGKITDGGGASNISGTSMATPQVAGLAAYMWALNDSLGAREVVDTIQSTARSDYPISSGGGCHSDTPQPIIDTPDALRAADNEKAVRALNDVADGTGQGGRNGQFDAFDIERMLASRSSGAQFNYGRMDLNGDGIEDFLSTSGNTEPVDLNGDGQRTTATADLEGFQRSFNETALSDLDVLCHDAYKATYYQGDRRQKNLRLAELCGIADVEILSPAAGASIPEGEYTDIKVEITLNTQRQGDLELRTGGAKVDEILDWVPADGARQIVTTARICPDKPSVTAEFTGDQWAIRASDSRTFKLSAPPKEAVIEGSNPRWAVVRNQNGTASAGGVQLRGHGHEPSCTDPDSAHVQPSQLQWAKAGSYIRDASGNVETGEQLSVPGTFLSDGMGGFEDKYVWLEYTATDGTTDRDRVQIKVCSPQDDAADRVAGYPDCPAFVVVGGYHSVVEQGILVGSMVDLLLKQNQFDRIIDRFGLGEVCDPRVCDPRGIGFPAGMATLGDQLTQGEWNPALVDYLTGNGGLLDVLSVDEVSVARPALAELSATVARDEALSASDKAFFNSAYSLAQAAIGEFASTAEGGGNAWAEIMSAETLDAFEASGLSRLKPARMAVRGYLAGVIEDNVRTEYSASAFALDAGHFASALGVYQVYRELTDPTGG